MIREFHLKKREVLENKNVFIYEPVKQIIDKIKSSKKNKIILTGVEDSGKKLTTLQYMSENEEIFVYLNVISLQHYNIAKTNIKMEAYIESIVAGELLKVLSVLGLDSQMLLLNSNVPYLKENPETLRNYKVGDLISSLIYRIRKLTDKNIVFVVDKMDLSNNDIQEIISKYFDLFDKSIIISSDNMVYNNKERQLDLINKDFDIIKVDYAKNPDVLIKIIDSRIEYYNKKCNPSNKLLTLNEMLDYKTISKIANLSNGNIRKILCIAKLLYSQDEKKLLSKEEMSTYILDSIQRSSEVDKFSPIKTLYL